MNTEKLKWLAEPLAAPNGADSNASWWDAFHRAANPSAILDMIAEVESLRDQVNGLTGSLDRAETVLQNLMSYLSVNGSWADVSPCEAEQRIRDGIDILVRPAVPAVPNDIIPEGDDFNGTTPHLIQCIESLVRLDAKGVLVPHGIGRDASKLLTAAANRLRQQAPAVPAEWREVMAELAADLQSTCDAEHPHRDQYPSVMRKYNNDMEIVEKARALLQSAEVRHD